MGNIQITKDKTTILKGFAILFMIAHHVLIKEFYINPGSILSSMPALRLQIGMKTCVGIFTFIIGYGFFFSKSYNIKYVVSHVFRLIWRYWIVLLLTVLLAKMFGGGYFDALVIILNIFGLKHQYNLGNWYIYFYIYALLVLPLIAGLLNGKFIYQKLAILIVLCGLLTYMNIIKGTLPDAARECTRYTPILAVGFVCAKTDILSKWSNIVKSRVTWSLLAFVSIIIRCGISSVFGIVTDIITVPLFVISISGLFQELKSDRFTKILLSLGSASTMMWFIHALPFSTVTRKLFQELPFWTNNIAVLFIVITIFSYLLAKLFEKSVALMNNTMVINVSKKRSNNCRGSWK